jgi:macrolide transport system ATP-binding/permease protein
MLNTVLLDVRQAVRSLLGAPVLTLAAALSLGLGIGANTTVFTWVQAVLLRPIPGAPETDRLRVAAMETRDGQSRSWSYPNYRDYRDRATLVEVVAQDDLAMSVAVDGRAERAYGGLVSGHYFQFMGVQPALGRLIGPDDDRTPGGHPVVVLSHAYWQRRFAGAPGIVGTQVTINNTPMTVIGVAADGFMGSFLGISTAAWVPMAMQGQVAGASRLEARGSGWMQVYTRLKPGVSRDQAQAEAATIMSQLAAEHPKSFDGWRLSLVNAWEAPFGAPQVLAPILGVLSIVVAMVLLIACANVANLLLSRAVGRRREVAIRLSLGASRWRLVRQLLTESLLLSAVAGGIGMVVAYWTSGVLMAFAPPTDMPIEFGLRVDGWTIVYAAAVSLVTGIVFGLTPAWQASRPDTVHALKEEAGRGSGGRTGQRLRGALVVAQVAVCLVLLVGASLFVRSLQAAQRVNPGFDPDGVLIASVDLLPNGYTPDTGRQFHRRLIEAVGALPGLQSVALARQVPLGLSGTNSSGVSIGGYTPQPDEDVNIVFNTVGPRYFETMRIPLASGREFTAQDTRETTPVVVVNETMARRYWSGRDAIGGRLRLGKVEFQVVGVARDIKYSSLPERPQPHMYLALEQNFTSAVVVHVRSVAAPATMLAALRDVIRGLDANLPIYDARTLEEHLGTAVFAQRMGANLLGVMGVLALVLAAVGLYGVIAYAVSQRTQEMGIRLALGAAPRDLLAMIVGQGLKLTGIGVAIGLGLAYVMAGFMGSLLPGIAPRDPITFIGVPLLLVVIALAAAIIPARRAGAVDPVTALRYQ